MSTDRDNRPLKPTLASTRTATSRTALTPRIAGSVTPKIAATPTTARPAVARVAAHAPLLPPRVRAQDVTPAKEPASNGNITPRSSARRSRVGVRSASDSPANDDSPHDARSRNGGALGEATMGRNSAVSGLSLGPSLGVPNKSRGTRPNSVVSESKSRLGRSPPLSRSPGVADFGQSGASNSFENRFFHASDAKKQESAPKRSEPKKAPTFFYADGYQDKRPSPPKEPSPVLSAVGEKRPPGPFLKAESSPIKSPQMLSPAFNQSSASLSYFSSAKPLTPLRSPSPSKENIHLSYRKGASQILGMRPTQRPNPSVPDLTSTLAQETRRTSGSLVHRKSSSLPSLNSGNDQLRRRSNTMLDESVPSSPLTQEICTPSMSRMTSPTSEMPSINTSLASSAIVGSPSESALLSPTKTVTQLAADARRERKVLDLEISNSSLLAINSSLERELRRQKAELKRFRRLSRAGRLSSATYSLPRGVSGDLETFGEEDDDGDLHDMPPGWDEDEYSDSEEDSSVSGSTARSSSATSELLAKDEKRLKVDLERHRELLIQSQAMNQSLKRCMYATEEMIRDGRKALEYHVRVSDVKLGGRILLPDQDEDETQDLIVDDDLHDNNQDGVDDANGLLDVWQGVVRPAFEGSEGSGRDSGIEVDKPYGLVSARSSNASNTTADSGRPPEHAS